jgi:predicted dehydrogenase
MMTRLGVIGVGMIFTKYDQAIKKLKHVEIVAVADPDPRRLAAAARHGRKLFTSAELLLDEPLDAILVLTPNASHPELVEACLRRGIDTLCEKPLATDAKTARDLVSLAKELDTLLYVAMHCRFRPEILYFRDSFSGNIVRFQQVYREYWMDAPAWYFDPLISGGGVLLDVGINQIDWILPFMDLPQLHDVSMSLSESEIPVEIDAQICWRFNGGEGTTELSWCAHPEEKYTRIYVQSGGVFELDHQQHIVRHNGRLYGPWPNEDYTLVICDFLQQRQNPGVRKQQRASELLVLIRDIYAFANLPFLDSSAIAEKSSGDKYKRSVL